MQGEDPYNMWVLVVSEFDLMLVRTCSYLFVPQELNTNASAVLLALAGRRILSRSCSFRA
jgi:hypothetical protein